MVNTYSQIARIKLFQTGFDIPNYDGDRRFYYIDYWKEVITKFSNVEVYYLSAAVKLSFDWTNLYNRAINRIENDISLKEFLMKRKAEQYEIEQALEEKEEFVYVNCEVSVNTDIRFKNNEVIKNHCFYILKNFLYDFYLVSNIVIPGSFDLYRTIIEVDGEERHQFNISSYGLESAWVYSLENDWPKLNILSLEDAWKWYKNLNIIGKQVSTNNIERALMSIFYIVEDSHARQNNLIWLAVALEALYDTPNALISKLLRDRIMLVLGEPLNKKQVTKRLSEFYNYRSRFVHGESKIFHPSLNSIMEPKLDEYIDKHNEVIDFATAILLATIQVIISKDYKGFNFIENYSDSKNDDQ